MSNKESQPIIKDRGLYRRSMLKAMAAPVLMGDGLVSIFVGSSVPRGAVGVVETIASVALIASSMVDADRAVDEYPSDKKEKSNRQK
jgi:hypothetical protein